MDDRLSNLRAFHESTGKELLEIRDRVRNLIGRSHWGEEGRYKEIILKDVIKRFLPRKYLVGTGFIVKTENRTPISSKQIDILVLDSNYPLLFSQGDFFITTPSSVRAVIEVKTKVQNGDLEDIIRRMNDIGRFIGQNNQNNPFNNFFNGFTCNEVNLLTKGYQS
jgi:hypothetical protein